MTDKSRPSRVIRNYDDLLAEWRSIKGRWGFSSHQLWVMFIDGQEGVHLLQIEDLPQRPEPGDAERLVQTLRHVSEGFTIGFMFGRPGRWPRRPEDLAWASELVREARLTELPIWPVHVACDDGVVVVAADDLSDAG